MIKVKVRNSKTDTNYESHEMSNAEADAWINEHLVRNAWGLPADLAIVKEDVTQELADKEQKKKDRSDRLDSLKALKGKNLSNAEIQFAVQALIKHATGD